MAESLKCEWAECPWESPKGSLTEVIKLYEMHSKARHSTNANHSGPKPEKAKHPEIASNGRSTRGRQRSSETTSSLSSWSIAVNSSDVTITATSDKLPEPRQLLQLIQIG